MTVKGQAEEPKVTPPAEGTSAEGQEPETAAGSESAEAQAGGEPTTQAPAETAVDAERARIKALEEMSAGMPGVEDLLVKAKYTEPMSPEQFALALVKSGKAKLAAQLAARRGDAQASGVNGVEPDARVDDSERGKATALLAKALAKVRGVQKG